MMNENAHILVVDDDIGIQRALQRSLSAYGYQVSTVSTGEEALEEIARKRPDLVLLDLGLPGMSGLDVCEKIRAGSNLPIIVLSIKNAEQDKVRALDLGADDYVSKPFGINEVLARVRVALRHATQRYPETEQVVKAGSLTIDFAKRKVLVGGRDIKLTPTEYELLAALVQHTGKIMTRHMLLSQVWGNGYEADAHYLHVYVAHLRQKIEPDPAHPCFILTIPGVGYRFNSEF
ncbi:MAG TPA: response regulator transcription factor [Ktedonobacteraceae bacterium]|jgi:two-component system KDP operon response regulator KdpE|nr:response regulator transcription factor [Ktedonobacteraceae bacterium]